MESNVTQLNHPEPPQPTWIRPRVFSQLTGMGSRNVYLELDAGRLQGVQVGRCRYIRASEVEAYFERNGKRAAKAAA